MSVFVENLDTLITGENMEYVRNMCSVDDCGERVVTLEDGV
jgi:hypothetical protein